MGMKTNSTLCAYVFTGLAVFFSIDASAWMIGNLPKDQLLTQSCRVDIKSPPHQNAEGKTVVSTVTCSATIIGRTLLASGAHCFKGKDIATASVTCPGEKPKVIKNWTIPKAYENSSDPFEVAKGAKNDMAVLRIDGHFRSKPALLPSGPEAIESIFEATEKGHPPDCRVGGYGEDEDLKVGNHQGRKVTFEKWQNGTETITSYRPDTGQIIKQETNPVFDWFQPENQSIFIRAEEEIGGKKMEAIRPGDSGGGVLCRNKDGDWILVGITTGFGKGFDENLKQVRVGSVVSVAHRFALLRKLLQQSENDTETGQPSKKDAPLQNRESQTLSSRSH